MSAVEHIRQEYVENHYEGYNYKEDKLKIGVKEPEWTTKTSLSQLLSTCIVHYSRYSKKLIKLVYMLQVDLDYKLVKDQRFIENNQISWERVHQYIREHHLYFMDYLFAATRSKSGKGLSLAFSIHPAVLWSAEEKKKDPSKAKFHKASSACQEMLIRAFDIAGCGADWGAKGGGWRLTTNWRLENRRVYYNPAIKKEIERNKRYVVRELLSKMNKDPLLKYQRKKDNLNKLLTPHISSELGFAKLYSELLDNDMTLFCSMEELVNITGISNKTIKKYLTKECPSWLKAEYLGYGEGWSLLLLPTKEHSQRAFKLLEKKLPSSEAKGFTVVKCKPPESVKAGERNTQITNWILRLKWAGYTRKIAEAHILRLISQIPSTKSSRNASAKAIIQKFNSLFKGSVDDRQSTCRVDFPSWLSPTNESFKREENLEEKQKKNKKHTPSSTLFPGDPSKEHRTYKIGADLHIQKGIGRFKNKKPGAKRPFVTKYAFFSIPNSERWRGKVCAVVSGEELLVFSMDKKTFICKHPLTQIPNTYVTTESHLEGWSGAEEYLSTLKTKYDFGRRVFASWESALNFDGYKAIRKIQRDIRNLSEKGVHDAR